MAALGSVSDKFLRSLSVTAAWEGGWSNNPRDPGGKTMFGVTNDTWTKFCAKVGLPNKPVRSITRSDAEQLFFSEFWNAAKCEGLAAGVDLATFDASVNSGVSRGLKWLMGSVGGSDVETVKRICAKRLTFVQALRNWKTFGKGWSNRIADVQAKGVAWALVATSDPRVIAEKVHQEADIKKASATKQTAGAGGAAAGTGGSVVAQQQPNQIADWALTGIGMLLFAALVYLLWRAFLNRQQAVALMAEAEKH